MVAMDSLSDDERKKVLGEVLMDELKAIYEYVKEIPVIRRDVDILKKDMIIVKSNIATIKSVLKDQGYQVKDHEQRITKLEGASA